MKSLKQPIFLLLLLTWGAMLGACTSKTAKDTSIPWSRPADWEGTMPGMGNRIQWLWLQGFEQIRNIFGVP